MPSAGRPTVIQSDHLVLGKPEEYISINYNHDDALSFAGTFEPAFLLVIVSQVHFLAAVPYFTFYRADITRQH
jgi:Macrophage migration inhibitory factor (MIF)